MSHFIANLLQYNEKENRFYVRGGSNNVVPRSNNFTHYEDNVFLLIDLISGGLKLNCQNSLSKKVKEAVKEIETNWAKQFKERNEKFGGCLSINPYSLYSITGYYRNDKEETLKYKFDVSRISEAYKKECLQEAEAIKEVWEEGKGFFKEQLNLFFNLINIPQN
jgi:hypothetical protein